MIEAISRFPGCYPGLDELEPLRGAYFRQYALKPLHSLRVFATPRETTSKSLCLSFLIYHLSLLIHFTFDCLCAGGSQCAQTSIAQTDHCRRGQSKETREHQTAVVASDGPRVLALPPGHWACDSRDNRDCSAHALIKHNPHLLHQRHHLS
jgi:hypothetical protein